MLYEKQEQAVKRIEKNIDNYCVNRTLYLSGEMGVGKTYIASAWVVRQLIKDNNQLALVVVPKQVLTKWQKVLGQFCKEQNYDGDIVVAKTAKQVVDYETKNGDILLVPHERFKNFVENKVKSEDEKMLVVFDEVHEVFSTSDRPNSKFFELEKLKQINENHKMLLLTGTIFNSHWKNVLKLISITHEELFNNIIKKNYKDISDEKITKILSTIADDYDISSFIRDFWQYISIELSIDDIKELSGNREDIKQVILPIKAIDLTEEQKAFTKIIKRNLKHLNISNIEENQMNFIDNPNKDLRISKRVRKSKLNRYSVVSDYMLSFPLLPVDFESTTKWQELKKFIKEKGEDKKYLIYANDPSLIEILVNKLDKSFTIPRGLEKEKFEDYFKNQFEINNIGIVDPREISTGIDISCDYLIWYQLLDNYSQSLQAQRRVYRLSSDKKTEVLFLIYKNTYQEKIAEDVSNSAKNNAAVQGTQLKNQLAKLTGIILGDVVDA